MAKLQRVVFYTFSPVSLAFEHLRVTGPMHYLGIELVRGVTDGVVTLDPITEADLVVLQRNFPGHFSEYLKVVEAAHAQGKPVLLDMDDNLLDLDQDHPDVLTSTIAFDLVSILSALRTVDAVTVTTTILQEAMFEHNEHVYVLPNYLDDEIWKIKPPRISDDYSSVTVIYIGTSSHLPDVEMIGEPLDLLAKKYPGKVEFIFYGTQPPTSLSEAANVSFSPSETHDYQSFAKIIEQFNADIAIAPLRDTSFNRNKSPIKFFEYTAMGLPCVFSDMPPYANVVTDGTTGFLAKTSEDWLEKLSKLIDSSLLRNNIVCQAQEELREKWILHDHVDIWRETYNEILLRGVVPQSDRLIRTDLLVHLAHQIEGRVILQAEKEHKLNLEIVQSEQRRQQEAENARIYEGMLAQKIVQSEQLRQQEAENARIYEEKLTREKDQLAADLQDTQREVVDYATSTSWKITRPLRKIMRHLRRD